MDLKKIKCRIKLYFIAVFGNSKHNTMFIYTPVINLLRGVKSLIFLMMNLGHSDIIDNNPLKS